MTTTDFRMRKTLRLFVATLAIVFGLASILGTGDASDNETDIRIINLDNEEYLVRLFGCGTAVHIAELEVDNFPNAGATDDFDDIADGCYFIRIFPDGGLPVTTSGNQTVDKDNDGCYQIEDDGDIRDCRP